MQTAGSNIKKSTVDKVASDITGWFKNVFRNKNHLLECSRKLVCF